MRKYLYILMLLCQQAAAQQAINNDGSPPHKTAMLDVKSSNKGFLLPRMSVFQRDGIAGPPKGLMLYNTTFSRFEMYDGTAWRYFLDNDQWARNGNYVYSFLPVGLGSSSSPGGRLDVWGNVRVTGGELFNVRSSGTGNNLNFQATGSQADYDSPGLQFNINGSRRGYLHFTFNNISRIFSIRLENGTLARLLNGFLDLNAPGAPIMQLQNSGTDKGFLQLSGDNLRIGTNSSNVAGQTVFRLNGTSRVFVLPNGNVGIGTDNPVEKLHVSGNVSGNGNFTAARLETGSVDVTNEVRKPAVTGNFNLVPIAYGFVAADGTINRATPNVTVTRTSTGVYEITVPGLTSACTIIVNGGSILTASYYTTNKCRVISNGDVDEISPTTSRYNTAFYFIIFQP